MRLQEKDMIESAVENENIKVWIDGNIMFSVYKTESVNVNQAHAMIQTRLALCAGKAYPFLADVSKLKSIDRAAREAFSHGEGIRLMPACALIVNSPVNKVLGNFFMAVNKPNIPTRLFTSIDDAKAWLKQFE
jgi:hypothetical protein